MAYIALLGDSVFDNKSYVGENGKDVTNHLQSLLKPGLDVELAAHDGSVIKEVSKRQIAEAEKDSTHLIVSAGGNDAIMNADILNLDVSNSAVALNEFANRQDSFREHYSEMLDALEATGKRVGVCTIYDPNFDDPQVQRVAKTALCVYNDLIIRMASKYGLPILDLRLICNKKEDYANEIEPSDKGGKKIAKKILELVENHDFNSKRTSIYF